LITQFFKYLSIGTFAGSHPSPGGSGTGNRWNAPGVVVEETRKHLSSIDEGDFVNVKRLPRRHPVPSLATAAFAVSLAVTVAYFAGLVPLVPKTLPTFVDLATVTGGLLVVAALA
jgi:hypothetical protein